MPRIADFPVVINDAQRELMEWQEKKEDFRKAVIVSLCLDILAVGVEVIFKPKPFVFMAIGLSAILGATIVLLGLLFYATLRVSQCQKKEIELTQLSYSRV